MDFNGKLIFSICLLIGVFEIPIISNGKQLFLGRFPTPKITNSPISINTSNTIKVNYPSLILRGVKYEKLTLTNTGKTIEFTASPFTRSFTAGGVLSPYVYKFKKIVFRWNDQKNGIAGSKIDGKGFPVEGVAYFYNLKYGTFTKSLNYRDGLAGVRFPVTYCPVPSISFIPLAKKLKQVLEPGKSTITLLGTVIGWYDHIPKGVTYYAYPGEYTDVVTNEKHYAETVILPDYPGSCISRQQFADTFGSIKNASGIPYSSSEKTYLQKQTVVQAQNINRFYKIFI